MCICYYTVDRGEKFLIPGCMYSAVHFIEKVEDCICRESSTQCRGIDSNLKSDIKELKEIINHQNKIINDVERTERVRRNSK